MDIILFYFSMVIFIALCYCISQVKTLSRQIDDLKKDLNRAKLTPNPDRPPARTATEGQGAQPDEAKVTIQTPGVTKTVPSFLLKNEAGLEGVASSEPQSASAKPEPVQTAASAPERKSPVQQVQTPPQPASQSSVPAAAQPSAPPQREVVVHHFPGVSSRITPGAEPKTAASGPAAPPRSQESAKHPEGVVPPPEKPERSPIEARTAETLSKMWQWLIVGEEYRPGGTTKEYAVATTWMLRAAVILLVLGLAYFIKYSHERNLLPPELRLSAATLFALVILGVGCKLLKGMKYRIFGTALAGAGFAGLYLCVFASVSIYHLLEAWIGLAGMAVLTAAGVALALRFDSIFLAMLAVCGGFLAPVLMNTGSRNLVGLFGYMTVLVAGSLVVARRRSWQAVNILTFLFTWGIYIASKPFPRDMSGHSYTAAWAKLPEWAVFGDQINRAYFIAVAFAALFFLAFCVQTVAFDLFSRRKVSLLELGFAALNGIVFLSVTLPPTITIYGREYAAIITFAGAVAYLLQIALLLKMKLEDRNLLLTLLVLSCGLIALTFPLLLEQDHLAVAWSVQAAAMLYIGCRTKSAVLVRLSYIVYLIAAVRLLGFDVAQGYARRLQGFWTRMMNFGSYTAALAGGFFMLKRYAAELYAVRGASADGTDGVSRYPRSSKVMFWCAFAVSFITIVGEFTYWKNMEDGGLIATGALYLLLLSLVPRLFRENTRGIINTGSVLLVFYLLLLLVGCPWIYWKCMDDLETISFLYRFCPNVWAVAALVLAGVFFGRLGLEAGAPDHLAENARGTGKFFIISAIVFWFFYSTNELGFQVGRYSSQGGARIAVSLLWGFYALVLLAFGILRRKRGVRIPALVLFAITVLKIFFYDLAGTPALYRVAGCMVTGAALVAGAWLYARFEQKGDSSDEPRS